MNCRLNAMQDSGIEEGVSLPELLTKGDSVEIIGFVDGLGRKFVQVGDVHVRVSSFADAEFRLPARVPRIIDVTPLASDDEGEAFVEDFVHQLMLTGPTKGRGTETVLAVEEDSTGGMPQPQLLTGPEPSTDLTPEPELGLYGD